MSRAAFETMLDAVQGAGEDFEWYPTTDRMIQAVARWIAMDTKSIMDIGAGDGRVLLQLAKKCERSPQLLAIEKSNVLIQAQPENVIPVGTDLFEQNLACLPVEIIFSNPPYSQYETWVTLIVESGHAERAYLVIPRRWKENALIADAINRRGATTRVIHSDDFYEAPRSARAVIDIVEVTYPRERFEGWRGRVEDPFDRWFNENISTFDEPEKSEEERAGDHLAKNRKLDSIHDLVEAYNEEFARMEANYRAIFHLDLEILKELGVNKENVRDGLKLKMAGLKAKYWGLLFERLDTITNRLSTATKDKFLAKLTGRTAIEFTVSNAYAIVLWAIKNANQYFAEQVKQLFHDLSTFDGVQNYKSNVRTWDKNRWRYNLEDDENSHYALDYRIVVERHGAMYPAADVWGRSEYPGNLHRRCHALIADIIAVLYNLGFQTRSEHSLNRQWSGGCWENWYLPGTDDTGPGAILFQVKAYKNGNVHLRFLPDAIKALNVEAGRLLGWLRTPADVETELGYTPEEAQRFYGCTRLIAPSNVKLLEGAA